MIETVDSLGNSEVLRRIPFWGSDVPLYAAQGFGFVPIQSVTVGQAPPSPSVPPALPATMPQQPPPPPPIPVSPPPPPVLPPQPPAVPADGPQRPPPPGAPGQCPVPPIEQLEPFVDLTSDESSLAVAFASSASTDFTLPVLVPLSSGDVAASIGATQLGQAAFTSTAAQVESVRAVLRTPVVYPRSDGVRDRDRVIVALQVRDAAGNSQVLRTGLSATLTLTQGASSSAATCTIAAVSGLATCIAPVPAAWFSMSVGSASAQLEIGYSGLGYAVASAAVGSIVLAAAPSHSGLSVSGMALSLPTSARFAGDLFDVSLSASLVGVSYGMRAWSVTLHFDESAFALVSYSVDGIWGDAQALQTSSSLNLVMNDPANAASSNPLVTGDGIPIMVVRLQVKVGVSAGSYPLSLDIASMLNFGGAFIVENGAALVLDHRPGSSAVGELEVEEASTAGLFAYPPGGRAVLRNTAPITGRDVNVGTITAVRVSTRPYASVSYAALSPTCSSAANGASIALAGCGVQLSQGFVAGGSVTLTVTSESHSTDVPLFVWYPGPLTIVTEQSELRLLQGCTDRYEWTQLRVRAGALDVTPLLLEGDLEPAVGVQLRWVSAAAGSTRLLVEGVSVGVATVALTAQPSVFVSLEVSASENVVLGFVAHLLTGMSPLLLAFSGASSFEAGYTLEQSLTAEGDTGEVYAYVQTATGLLGPVPASELVVHNLTSGLAVSQSGDAPWQATVASGAVRECGSLLHVRWDVCDAVFEQVDAQVSLNLPGPSGVRITTPSLELAPLDDLATLAGIGKSTSAALSVLVDFEDPVTSVVSSLDFSTDGRMSLLAEPSCATSSGNTVSTVSDASGCAGSATFNVSASVQFGSGPALVSAPLTVDLVRFAQLQLQLGAHPQGPADMSELHLVQCTNVYQRVQPSVVAELSNGETPSVTAQCTYSSSDNSVSVLGSGAASVFAGQEAGTASITASFSTASVARQLSVIETPVDVDVMTLLSDAGATILGGVGDSFGTKLNLLMQDGTIYPDLHSLSWLPASEIVEYDSTYSGALSVGSADGTLVLHSNHHEEVGITASTICAPLVDDSLSLAPNLLPPLRGLDLGTNSGLQFQPTPTTLDVPVIVQAGADKLTSFQIIVEFDDSMLLATGYSEGITSGSGATSFFGGPSVSLNVPTNEALLVGNKDGSVAPSGTVQLATLHFNLVPGASGLTLITARVEGLITCSVCDGSDDDDSSELGALVVGADAGAGNVWLGGSRRALEMPLSPRVLRPRRALLAEGTCCSGAIPGGRYFGDTNGDCVFDIIDVRRASVLLLAGAGPIPTSWNGQPLCDWQQKQLDPTQDAQFKQNDALYLLNALAKKYRFLGDISTSNGPYVGSMTPWQVDAQLYTEASLPASTGTAVQMQLSTSGAGMPALSVLQGTAGERHTRLNAHTPPHTRMLALVAVAA